MGIRRPARQAASVLPAGLAQVFEHGAGHSPFGLNGPPDHLNLNPGVHRYFLPGKICHQRRNSESASKCQACAIPQRKTARRVADNNSPVV